MGVSASESRKESSSFLFEARPEPKEFERDVESIRSLVTDLAGESRDGEGGRGRGPSPVSDSGFEGSRKFKSIKSATSSRGRARRRAVSVAVYSTDQ